MKRTYKNSQMVDMLDKLQPLLQHRDKIGYAVARNHRRLSECLTEYERFRNDLIMKYGEREKDEDGNELPRMLIAVNSPNFKMFVEELAPYNEMEHEVEIFTLPYEDAIGILTGEEILAIDWMLVDEEAK